MTEIEVSVLTDVSDGDQALEGRFTTGGNCTRAYCRGVVVKLFRTGR
jgi:hypothetical protein